MKNDELFLCKYCVGGVDNNDLSIPCCSLNCGLPCDDVLRFADEECKYKPEENEDIF